MAGEEDAPVRAAGGVKELLGKKIGPLPVGVWLAIAGGVAYFVVKRRGAGKVGTTDPAGNVGTIDPATGYVSGSPQDQAGLTGGGAGGGGTSGGSGSSGSTVGGQYQDNAAWGRAAINYLVGVGVDPTEANEAVQSFLSSQTLTQPQQADVNLAVQALGAPPTPPSPTGTQPPPIVNPPAGTTYAANPPGSLTVASKTDTSVNLTWSRAANATGYVVRYGTTSSAGDGSVSTGPDAPAATVGGLRPGTNYTFQVQAQPAKTGAPYATTTAQTTAATPTGGGGGGTSGGSGGGDWTTHTTVHEGEHLSEVLAYGGGMSQADFEAHNPGITGFYKWYIPGKGYQSGPGNGAVIALNVQQDKIVTVKSGGF